MAAAPRHALVLDDFLAPGLHQALLDHALEQHAATEPARVYRGDQELLDSDMRRSDLCRAGLGALHDPFVNAVTAQLDTMLSALGLRPFAIARVEAELVAHNDGAHFGMHIDTLTEAELDARDTTRILSVVYYLHRAPQGFSGGDLDLRPVGSDNPLVIEPRDNRLVAFPSYTPHQVRRVACLSRDFADSRFAVNMWLSRARRRAA